MLTLEDFFKTYEPEEKQAAMKAVGGSYYEPKHVRFKQCLNAMDKYIQRLKTIVAAKKGYYIVVLSEAEIARLNNTAQKEAVQRKKKKIARKKKLANLPVATYVSTLSDGKIEVHLGNPLHTFKLRGGESGYGKFVLYRGKRFYYEKF